MYRLLLTAIMVVGVLSGFVEGGTIAYLTSSSSASSRFLAGSVELTAAESSGTLMLSDLTPGDSVTVELTITNSGDNTLRYAMRTPSTTATGANLTFFQALDADIWPKAANGNCTTEPTTGQLLYTGALDSAAFGLDASNNANRELPPASSNSEVLCFRISFPATETTTQQGRIALVDYRFVAFQAAGTNTTGTP